MSIRLTALYIFVAILLVYAWKDWFKSLCGLILMMAIIEHEDMPKAMFGIQGFNMWNLLFLGIFLAWLVNRRREGLTWDMPRHINVLLLLQLVIILIGFGRLILDPAELSRTYGLRSLISERLLNTIKWVLPGVLLFDGCRTRHRLILAIVCLLGLYFFVAAQLIWRIPASVALEPETYQSAHIRLRFCQELGYSAATLSTMVAGASWAILASNQLIHRKKFKALLLGVAGMVLFSQSLTGGRGGYLAWGVVGLLLCTVKWRKYLVLFPIALVGLSLILPGVVDRLSFGLYQVNITGESKLDRRAKDILSSGRTEFWPVVIDKIWESPLFGYGREGMSSSGAQENLLAEFGDSYDAGHPHNMYLQWILDNGIVGFVPIVLFYGIV
ncbi:O-antigen ligase family protein, partial [Planctomycetota bacterium]